MEIYNNDRRLVDKVTPIDQLDQDSPDADEKMCAEIYNDISQWVLEKPLDLKLMGHKALRVFMAVSGGELTPDDLFGRLDTEGARLRAKETLRVIYGWIVDSADFEMMGRKALCVLAAIREDHVAMSSLEEIAKIAGCTKQGVWGHQKRFRAAMRTAGKIKKMKKVKSVSS
jgi:hypothetical protein